MAFIKQILAPTDFSRNSSHAINYACDLAKQSNARLHLLHIVSKGATSREIVERLERIGAMVDARAELALDTVKEIQPGNPSAVISQYASDQEIDLIVMGTHGRTGLSHLTMGSVAEHIVREAPCPVLVLGPRDGESASLKRAAEVLMGQKFDELESLEDGRTRMHLALVDELRIPATTAILLIDELEDRQWLKYEHGKWVLDQDSEPWQADEEFVPDFSTDSPAIDLIKRANRLSATDLHIDPAEDDKHRVRFRVDGQLREYCKLHGDVAVHLINQLKTLAAVDIADPFNPQESHLRLPTELANLDIRLTTIPVAGGTAVALRLFDQGKIRLPLDTLGFSESALATVHEMRQRYEGLVLISGPTGSGKTTTVYSLLQSVGGVEKNIVSIEDPVEYAVPFIRQMNVDPKHGISMKGGLQIMLRMDPDVVFVGEIRDPETAQMGMRAASSGKYIFSTMHTRDIASTIEALREMQIENRTLASHLAGIINQRLVRRLCAHCKRPADVTPQQRARYESVDMACPDQLYEPVGCSSCRGDGFHGRVGIFEVSKLSTELREAISRDLPAVDIERELRRSGSASLEQDALAKAADGLISFDEAIGSRWLS